MESVRIAANGLEFSALSMGTGGSLVLCAHGFPETAATFDKTLAYLAEHRLRAVAPHMRGYAPTTVAGISRFHGNDLGEDLLALADVLSPHEPVTLIGHDWGALAVYRAAAMRPERVRSLITVGIPHGAMVRPSLRLAWGLRHFVAFQLRGRAVAKMRENDFAGVDALYRRWSPTWNFSPEETAPIKETFRVPGSLEGALSYYWHFASQTKEEARRARELDKKSIPVPATIVLGTADRVLIKSDVRERPDIFPQGAELAWVDGAGHFVHREQPEAWLKILAEKVLGRAS